MIKDNFVIIKKYFKLVKGNRIGIFKLFFSSVVSHGISLLIPIIIANIIKNITIQNYNDAYICSFMLFLSYLFYNLFLKWNYDVYTQNTKYCCSKIQKDIIMKISTYDDNFQNQVSKGELISTINQDVIDLTKCIDRIAEYIINSISFIWLIIIVFTINSISALIIFIVCFVYLVLYNRCNKKIVKYTGLSRKNMDNFKLVQNNEDKIKETCKKIGIDELILNLPNGYETILKEDATDLSGGQKQLISIARTIMCDSKIIIFDEVTSALDPKTTKHIIEILNAIKKDKVVILITHKPDLMKIANNLILLNDGKIVGIGNHKGLIANNNYYQKLLKK